MKLRVIPEPELHLLGKEAQLGYLLRVWQKIQEGDCWQCPFWLYFVTLAFFTGNTEEIEGTYDMDTYRQVLLNQLLP